MSALAAAPFVFVGAAATWLAGSTAFDSRMELRPRLFLSAALALAAACCAYAAREQLRPPPPAPKAAHVWILAETRAVRPGEDCDAVARELALDRVHYWPKIRVECSAPDRKM